VSSFLGKKIKLDKTKCADLVLPHEGWFSSGFLSVFPPEARFSSGFF